MREHSSRRVRERGAPTCTANHTAWGLGEEQMALVHSSVGPPARDAKRLLAMDALGLAYVAFALALCNVCPAHFFLLALAFLALTTCTTRARTVRCAVCRALCVASHGGGNRADGGGWWTLLDANEPAQGRRMDAHRPVLFVDWYV